MSDMVNKDSSNYSDRIGKGNAIDLSDGYLFDVVQNHSINALPLMGDPLKYVESIMNVVCKRN